jgi:hypothetical protein
MQRLVEREVFEKVLCEDIRNAVKRKPLTDIENLIHPWKGLHININPARNHVATTTKMYLQSAILVSNGQVIKLFAQSRSAYA